MKIADVIKQLQTLKKIHGNIPVYMNGGSSFIQHIGGIVPHYPFDSKICNDETVPPTSILITPFKS